MCEDEVYCQRVKQSADYYLQRALKNPECKYILDTSWYALHAMYPCMPNEDLRDYVIRAKDKVADLTDQFERNQREAINS